MSSKYRLSALFSFVLVLPMALTACGGGGGGGGGVASSGTAGVNPAPAASAVTPTTPPDPAASAVANPGPGDTAPVTPVVPVTPTDPVPGGSVACAPGDAPATRTAAFSLVNIVRMALGLPQMARLPAFDSTAQAHAQYLVANDGSGIDETPGLPCYTGADLLQRLAGAGIATAELTGARPRSEIVIAYTTPAGAELQPWDLVNGTLDNLYGRMFLLDPRSQQLGLGFSAKPGGAQRALVFDTALLPGTANPASTPWVVWPRDGTTGLPVRMRASNMKPLDASITEGYPVSLHAVAAVQVSRFVLTNATSGTPVTATLVNSGNDRNGFMTPGEAALVPHAPLAAGTTYRAELDAVVGGTPVHLVWSFTTAP